MIALTRCRDDDANTESWLIFYGDVQVGTIKIRAGNAWGTPSWEWRCGLYPSSNPGESRSGTAATFDEARAEFGLAWEVFLSNPTEVDFPFRRREISGTGPKNIGAFQAGRATVSWEFQSSSRSLAQPRSMEFLIGARPRCSLKTMLRPVGGTAASVTGENFGSCAQEFFSSSRL